MAFEQRVMKVTPHTYTRVTAVKHELEAEKQRQVTYDEAVEYLLDYRDAAARIATKAAR